MATKIIKALLALLMPPVMDPITSQIMPKVQPATRTTFALACFAALTTKKGGARCSRVRSYFIA